MMKICEDDDDGDGTGDDVALDDEWDLWKVLLLEFVSPLQRYFLWL